MKKLLIALAGALALSACQIPEPAEPETPVVVAPTPTPTERVVLPQKGGLLRISMRHPSTFNPLLNEDITIDKTLRLIFEPLAVLDENQKVQPNLLEGINFATGGQSVILTLKPGLKWSDGEPITAADIIYSLDTLRIDAPEQAIYKSFMQNILSYSLAEDASGEWNAVKIVYEQAFGGAAYQLCFPIIPKHYYAGITDPTALPLGNGLYTCTKYEDMKVLTMSATTGALGKSPYISNIEAIVLSDTETDLYAFDQNMIDAVSASISDWGKYLSSGSADAQEYITQYFDFVGFNFNNPTFQNKNMRIAIAHLIDKHKLITDVYAGHAISTNTPVNPNSWLYENGSQSYGYNLELAQSLIDGKLLDETPVESQPEKAEPSAVEPEEIDLEAVEPEVIRILVNSENEERIKIATLLKEALLQVNLQAELDVCSFAEYEQKLKNKHFDLFVGGINLSTIPDLTFLLHSTQTASGMNYFSYKDGRMDALLTEAFISPSEASFKSVQSELQKYISEELPFISLVFRKSVLLTTPNVYGAKKPSTSNIYSNIEEWFISER